jgi:hypothetical protein
MIKKVVIPKLPFTIIKTADSNISICSFDYKHWTDVAICVVQDLIYINDNDKSLCAFSCFGANVVRSDSHSTLISVGDSIFCIMADTTTDGLIVTFKSIVRGITPIEVSFGQRRIFSTSPIKTLVYYEIAKIINIVKKNSECLLITILYHGIDGNPCIYQHEVVGKDPVVQENYLITYNYDGEWKTGFIIANYYSNSSGSGYDIFLNHMLLPPVL